MIGITEIRSGCFICFGKNASSHSHHAKGLKINKVCSSFFQMIKNSVFMQEEQWRKLGKQTCHVWNQLHNFSPKIIEQSLHKSLRTVLLLIFLFTQTDRDRHSLQNCNKLPSVYFRRIYLFLTSCYNSLKNQWSWIPNEAISQVTPLPTSTKEMCWLIIWPY